MAYMGGHRITGASWIGPNAIAVQFAASDDGLFRQLYAGRTLIGVTTHPDDREVVGQLFHSEWPQDLILVAVESANRTTEYGDTFGVGPWNAVRIRVSTSSYPADAARLEITAGTSAGGAVDDANVLGQIIFEGDGTYEFQTQPLGDSGTWNLEVTPYDDKGNAGTALATSVALISRAQDVVLQDDDTRLFDFSIAAQTLNLSVVLP